MPDPTEDFADPTAAPQANPAFDDALRSLRIGGSLLLRESYVVPWAIAIPSAEQLGRILGVRRGVRAVAFHLVEAGQCTLKPDGERADTEGLALAEGELAVCFGGAGHRLGLGRGARVEAVDGLLAGGANPRRVDPAGGQPATSLICGVFLLQHTVLNPLFAGLPPVMRASLAGPGDDEAAGLRGVGRLLAEELDRGGLGAGYIVERLLEVLCAEAIRTYTDRLPSEGPAWLRALRDPAVGRALAAIHQRPDEPWSIQRLAERSGLSPSRLAARFAEALGEGPMAYVTRWRMSLACRRLQEGQERIESIAASLGYESAPAFSRAFKRTLGVSPAGYRGGERT